MASGYVGHDDSGWIYVIDGAKHGPFATQQEAERAYNDASGQSNAPAAGAGGVSDAAIQAWAQSVGVSADVGRAFVKANGRLPASIGELQAFTGSSGAPASSGYATGQEAFNPQVYAQLLPLIQQAYNEERLRLIDLPGLQIQKDTLALNAAAQVANQALGQANLLASLNGPANAFKRMEVMQGLNAQGGSKLFDAILGTSALPAFQAPQATPVPASIQSLVHDAVWSGGVQGNSPLLDQYNRIAGGAAAGTAAPGTTAAPAVSISAQQINDMARGLNIDPRFVQGYVSANGSLPSNPQQIGDYMTQIGGSPPNVPITGTGAQAAATPATTQAPATTTPTPQAQPAVVPPVTTQPASGGYGISSTEQPMRAQGYGFEAPTIAQPPPAPTVTPPPATGQPAYDIRPPTFGTQPAAPGGGGYSVGPPQNPTTAPTYQGAPRNPGDVYDMVLYRGQEFKNQNGRWPTPDEWTSIYGGYMTPAQAAAIVQRSQDFQTQNGRAPTRDEWTTGIYRSPQQLQYEADLQKFKDVPPNQMNIRAYLGSSAADQASTLSGYQAVGYDQADILHTIDQLKPQFAAPKFGMVR